MDLRRRVASPECGMQDMQKELSHTKKYGGDVQAALFAAGLEQRATSLYTPRPTDQVQMLREMLISAARVWHTVALLRLRWSLMTDRKHKIRSFGGDRMDALAVVQERAARELDFSICSTA